MMKLYAAFIFWLLLPVVAFSQYNFEKGTELNIGAFGLLGGIKNPSTTNLKSNGIGLAVSCTNFVTEAGLKPKQFSLIGLWGIDCGYGRKLQSLNESRGWIPLNLWLGFAGMYTLNDALSVGVLYNFITIKGYQNIAFAGSDIGLIGKYKKTVVTLCREKDGLVTGAFKAKNNGFQTYYVQISYQILERLQAGYKFTIVNQGESNQTNNHNITLWVNCF